MNIIETFRTSTIALNANKVRSFLTMLGVIIGVFSVVTLISIGQGIQNYITDQFDAIGAGVLFVVPGKVDFTGDPAESFTLNKLEEKHIDLIETYAKDYVLTVSPSVRASNTVEYRNKSFFASVLGPNEDGFKIFKLGLENGRFFNKSEVKSKKKVATIGPNVREELFGTENPIGKKIKIADESFEIIGYTGEKGQDFDDNVYIPYTTMMDVLDIENFSGIAVESKPPEDPKYKDKQIKLTMRNIELALLRDLDEDEFSVISAQDILSSVQNILGIVTTGLGAIAGISLLVGGIGIMNIMLVSVTERIKEIGLRKALGATPRNIAAQFLIESVLLSLSGGSIGLLLGFGASLAAQRFIRAEIPISAVILALGFSIAVGVIFGTYPAIRASKLDPIEALRYE